MKNETMKNPATPKLNVAILVFPDMEPLDAIGPFEVFGAARTKKESEERLFNTFTIAETMNPVKCRYGLTVVPNYVITNHPLIDILVLPGGKGTPAAASRAELIAWIQKQHATSTMTLSVCTGVFLLAEAGLLDGLRATTHWASLTRLAAEYPNIRVESEKRWVENGRIVVSAGVSAGIDASLRVVERLFGMQAAKSTGEGIEYLGAR